MILILGMPGSGKTTQTEALGGYLKCPWFSMGELIRQKATDGDRELMLQGKIIPDEPTLRILWNELKDLDLVNQECVVEGNPRSIPQAEWWMDKIKAGHIRFHEPLIHLVISAADAEARLKQRGRVDDEDIEVMQERFAQYHRSVKPTLDYLKKNGVQVHEVNAGQSVEQVSADIKKALGI